MMHILSRHIQTLSRALLRTFGMPLKDFFFPPVCLACTSFLQDGEVRICSVCWNSLRLIESDDPTLIAMRQRFAGEGIIDGFNSCFLFEHNGVLQTMIHLLKYDAMTGVGEALGRKLGERILQEKMHERIHGIIPIPLHVLKQRERGYNQSEFLCTGIGRMISLPVETGLVRRNKYTQTQTQLNAEERKENMMDAFVVPERYRSMIAGRSFLLVDDVITTGSTIQSVANVLKQAGAQKVYAASVGLAALQ